MKKLANDWLTKDLIDFEYKKYVLLAYLQHVKKSFDKSELYPFLSDLVFHYRNLLSVKKNKEILREYFPKEISKVDFQKLKLVYKKIVEDDETMRELEDILTFSIPKVQEMLEEGKDIYEFVESQCEIQPIGLMPLYENEGYVFLSQPPQKDAKIYRYQISIFENTDEKVKGIHTEYVSTVQKRPLHTFEQIKLDLIRSNSHLLNPATYLIISGIHFPFHETFMPVAKRLLVKYITDSGSKDKI